MAKSAGLGDGLLVAGFDVSGDVGSISGIQTTFGQQNMTSISMSAMDRRQLVGNGSLGYNNFFNDSDGSGAEARGIHDLLTGATPGPRSTTLVSYHRGRSVGSWVANLEALRFTYSLARTQSGSLLGTVNANSTGAGERAIYWGRSLTPFVASPASALPTGVLTMDAQAEVADTILIGATLYTFAASLTAAGEIAIGDTVADTITNIVAAIMGTDGENSPHPDVTAAAGASPTVVVTAKVADSAALLIATVYTHDDGNENSFADATLQGDLDVAYPAFELGSSTGRLWIHVLEFAGDDATVKVQDSADGSTGWADLETLWDESDTPPYTGSVDFTGAEDHLRVLVETTDGFTALRFAVSAIAL